MHAPVPILFTIPNFITAGTGRAMLNIIERLDRDEFAPSICVLRRGGALEREVKRQGVVLLDHPFTVPVRPYRSLPSRAWAASRAFLPHRFALWHSFHYSDDYTEPLVAKLAGARAWVYTKKNMSWGGRAWRLRSLLADRIVTINTAMAGRFFGDRWNGPKVRYQPRGVDTGKFSPGSADPILRRSWGFAPDSFVVAHVANFTPVKDHPLLLRALARADARVCLVLAGAPLDETYVASVRDEVARFGLAQRVRLPGRVDDVVTLLRTADAFAFCSRDEGFAVAVIEAMACGLPCAATDFDSLRDLHAPGETALVTPSGDAEALAAALDRLAGDPGLCRVLGERARRRAETLFDVDVEARGHSDLYREVLSRKGVSPPCRRAEPEPLLSGAC
jgi:glycosyltransferase involved in cell wall biosynthesis